MGEPLFQINILPVGEGDCIHLRFFSDHHWYNIIIDSGPGKMDEDEDEDEDEVEDLPFLKLLRSIKKKGEKVDLLCFTHSDDDHIEAATKVFAEYTDLGELIREVWLNIPEYETKQVECKTPGGLQHISVKNAKELYQYILWYVKEGKLVCRTRVPGDEDFHSKDVKVSAVLPDAFRLERFEEKWEKYSPRKEGLEHISTKKPSDQSKTNGASIVLLVEGYGWRMLFTGDTFAVNLCDMVKEQEEKGENVHYDLVKLPHHGSSANISRDMLNKLNCKRFVISADGVERHSQRRPDQETVDYLNAYGRKHGGVTLYGNYEWKHIREKDRVQIVKLTGEDIMLTESISIKSEEPTC